MCFLGGGFCLTAHATTFNPKSWVILNYFFCLLSHFLWWTYIDSLEKYSNYCLNNSVVTSSSYLCCFLKKASIAEVKTDVSCVWNLNIKFKTIINKLNQNMLEMEMDVSPSELSIQKDLYLLQWC